MHEVDREWRLKVDVSEKTIPIASEFMRICDLATLGGDTAIALL